MNDADLVLAVDIGTSSVRAQVFTPGGEVVAGAKKEYPTSRPSPDREEQDPDLIRESTYEAMASALAATPRPDRVGSVSFSSQLYSLIALDRSDRPLTPSITWADGRAQEQAGALASRIDADDLHDRTGCPVDSIFPLAKLLWIRETQPAEFAAARRFVSVKEYVTAPLVGEWAVDVSVASATGLLDIAAGSWHGPALELAGITPDRLSSPVSGLTRFPLRADLPVPLPGLRPDASVFLGAGDGPLANLGSGARRPGAVNVDLGTSGAARAITRTPVVDAAHSLWCFCLTDDLWVSGGIVTNVGNALQWLAGTFEPDRPPAESTARLVSLSAGVAPGAEGLTFVPYLRRARSPYWDGRLRGVLHGLRADHTAAHITRALLEAIAYDLHTITTRIDEREPLAEPLRLTGGLTRSVCVAQLLADVCGRDVLVPRNTEGSIAGAAMFGLRAAGVLDAFAFAGDAAPGDLFEPDPEAHGIYTAARRRYERLIGLLREFAAEGDPA